MLAISAREMGQRHEARSYLQETLQRLPLLRAPSDRLLEELSWELVAFPEHREIARSIMADLVGKTQHWWTYLCLAVLEESSQPANSRRFRETATRLWPGTEDEFLVKESALRWIFEDNSSD